MFSARLKSLNQVSEIARAAFVKLQNVIFHVVKSDFSYADHIVSLIWVLHGAANMRVSKRIVNGAG